MKNVSFGILLAVVASCLLLFVGCNTGDDPKHYACSFEKSSTDGCDGYGWGPWEAGCQDINADNITSTPQQVCASMTTGGLTCELGCCVDFRYQNVSLREGHCPGR